MTAPRPGPGLARKALGASLFLATIVVAADARADAAEDRLKQARAELAAGKIAEACESFALSQKARPQGATLLELGLCHAKQGKIATAWGELIDAAAAARKERHRERENKATRESRALEPRLPQLTVVVPAADVDGLAITIDGVPLARDAWGTAHPVDPGDRTVWASAPGKKTWTGTVSLKEKQKASITIGALEDEAPPAPAPAAAPKAAAAPPPKVEEAAPAPPSHGDRFVLEVGFAGGLVYGTGDTGTLEGIGSLDYTFPTTVGDFIQVCGEQNCTAAFDESAGLLLGGQLFAGWALSADVHLGARGLFGPRVGGGFLAAGGPSISARLLPAPVDRLWLGASLLVGGMEQTADVASVRGVGPRGLTTPSGDKDIEVALRDDTAREGTVPTDVAIGGQVELSYALVDWDVLQGSVMVSLWPTYLHGSNGFALAVPVGIGYRFH